MLLLAFLSQYGIYLARRYRLTRTVFRGLRFHQTGNGVRYSICAVWWWGWTVLTLGFAYPFMRAALERFKMRNTWYGDLQGRFEGSGWRLFIRGFLLWLVVLVPMLATIAALLPINWSAVGGALRGGGDVLARIEKASPGFFTAARRRHRHARRDDHPDRADPARLSRHGDALVGFRHPLRRHRRAFASADARRVFRLSAIHRLSRRFRYRWFWSASSLRCC